MVSWEGVILIWGGIRILYKGDVNVMGNLEEKIIFLFILIGVEFEYLN